MVSALASSSVRLPRSVSVKVLVSDWDLLRSKGNSKLVYYFFSERGKVKVRCKEMLLLAFILLTSMTNDFLCDFYG